MINNMLEKYFLRKLISVESKFDRIGDSLTKINTAEKFDKYFESIVSDIDWLNDFLFSGEYSEETYHVALKYLEVYNIYLRLVSNIISSGFIDDDNNLFNLYNQLVKIFSNGKVIAPNFFDNLNSMLNMFDYSYGISNEKKIVSSYYSNTPFFETGVSERAKAM